MSLHVATIVEGLVTYLALVRLLTRVNSLMAEPTPMGQELAAEPALLCLTLHFLRVSL